MTRKRTFPNDWTVKKANNTRHLDQDPDLHRSNNKHKSTEPPRLATITRSRLVDHSFVKQLRLLTNHRFTTKHRFSLDQKD